MGCLDLKAGDADGSDLESVHPTFGVKGPLCKVKLRVLFDNKASSIILSPCTVLMALLSDIERVVLYQILSLVLYHARRTNFQTPSPLSMS